MTKPLSQRVHMVFPQVEIVEAKVTKKGDFMAEFAWLGGKRVLFGDDAKSLMGREGEKITVRGVPSDDGRFLNDIEIEFLEGLEAVQPAQGEGDEGSQSPPEDSRPKRAKRGLVR